MKVLIAACLVALVASTAGAQRPDSGAVQVTVEESMGMLAGFTVQAAGRTAATDARGVARLILPVGRQTVAVGRVGFRPARIVVTVVRDSLVTARVTMAMSEEAMEMEAVKISATRIEKLAGETPIRVELVDEMEVDEKTLMSPSGIAMLLNETPGLRVQAAAPGLGTGSVRILGLPGQYTVMLADGLPLYGGSASALGPLDISPVDLQRVEIIKGAASALYGGQSLGGVIDLISKAPSGKKEVLFNRRMLGVTDAATWLSHKFSEHSGVSVLAAGTVQSAEDVDRDGWADQAKAARWSVRPRYQFTGAHGSTVFLTAGYGFDDRDGGTLDGAVSPDGVPFREGLRSNRFDVGMTTSSPRPGGVLASRVALSSNRRERVFGSGPREDDRMSTGFAEVTRSFVRAERATLFGAAVQLDEYQNKLNGAFNHNWFTPALFATTERTRGEWTVSTSLRADFHPEIGLRPTERIAVMWKPGEDWSYRASVGTGYAAPSATTEETEATGLRRIVAGPDLAAEHSYGGMLDINGKLFGAELLATGYLSTIRGAIQLRDPENPSAQATLRNAATDTRIGGIEAVAVWRWVGLKLIGTYGYAKGSRPNAVTSVREEMPMMPRHRIGADLMGEKEGVYRWGIEGTWFAEQALEDNPFRSKSKPYAYLMAIAARQFGPWEVVANFENLLDVRQTNYDPLVRPVPMASGRWTTDVWAPLEGFMANVALRYRWQ